MEFNYATEQENNLNSHDLKKKQWRGEIWPNTVLRRIFIQFDCFFFSDGKFDLRLDASLYFTL